MTNIAIACQGGGSHTAFTAGVLKQVLTNWREEWNLVGLSGTSGGAVNAVTAWYGLMTGGPDRAAELLDAVWDDIAAEGPVETVVNQALVWGQRVEASGFPVPRVSPSFLPGARAGRREFRETIERHVDFEELVTLCRAEEECPHLVIGTVDVNAGEFETFTDETITADAVLASAAVPTLFPAVEMNGHYHWDGLFSQNPPVHELFSVTPARKPDELWVVQINPQEYDGEPASLDEIADRRNALSGNISLNQELRFVETVNAWIEEGHLPDEFRHTDVRRLELGEQLHATTKLDRSPAFVDRLLTRGEERAAAFLADR